MTTILVIAVIISLGISVWLGITLAKLRSETNRLSSLKDLQLVYIQNLIKAVSKEGELVEKLRQINEAKNEDDLNAIYDRIIG